MKFALLAVLTVFACATPDSVPESVDPPVAGTPTATSLAARAVSFATEPNGRCFPCVMTITTDSSPVTVDSTAGVALILPSSGGVQVAYSALDGSGGYENEGQSMWIIDVGTKERRRVMSEYVQVREIREVVAPDGTALLVVRLEDGGAGMSHIAFVDPARGQLSRVPRALVASVVGDTIELHRWDGEGPWTEPGGRDPRTGLLRAPPVEILRLSLSEIMRGQVLENPRSPQ